MRVAGLQMSLRQTASHTKTAKRGTTLGIGLGVLALTGSLVACGGSATPTAAASPSAAATSAAPSAAPSPSAPAPSPTAPVDPAKAACEYRKDDTGSPAKFVGFPPKTPSKSSLKANKMTIKTNQGTIVIDIAPGQTPCTINSFAYLAKKNFFDGTVCHRLVTPETNGLGLLQCGDPQAKGDGESLSDGTGGPGYLFGDENLGPQYTRGVVFMAQAPDASNSNGSQFAISTTDETAQLDQAYTPFGIVAKGMDVLDKIVAGGVNTAKDGVDITSDNGGSNAPKLKVQIKDLTIS
jgi:peptidyl-prolyl cis-trans isomerase B (cyclophilin B)